MERIKPLVRISVILLILFGILTCKEPTDLMDALDDEVKQANGLYLEIVSITPENNAANVDPGDNIQIEFDRNINETDLETYITLLDADGTPFTSEVAEKSLDFSFNSTNKVLTITAEPYLDGLVEYTLNILEGLEGTDGSQLREPVSRVFDTKDTPRGFFEINRDYTNQTTIDAMIETQGATFYMVSYNEDFTGAGWEVITSGIMTIDEIPIAGTNGENTLYARFRDGAVNEAGTANISSVEEDTVIFDNTAPGISFADDIVYSNDSSSVNIDPTVTDNSGDSAIETYLWEEVEGDTVEITNSTSKSGTISAGSGNDGNYTMRLTVTDKAGNSSSRDLTYTCDSVPPTLDIGSSYTQKSNTDLDLSASATDNIGIKSYIWEKISGTGTVTFDSIDSSDIKLQMTDQETYTIRVTVYDLAGNSFYKDVEVICSDTAPIIKFGSSVYYLNSSNYNKNSVVLTANIESATDYDYVWTVPAGITLSSTSGNGVSSSVTSLTPTIDAPAASDAKYTLTLQVTSAGGTTSSDVTVYRDIVAPYVNIGSSILYANNSNTDPKISASVSDSTSGINYDSLIWSSNIISGATKVIFGDANSSSTSIYLDYDGEASVSLNVYDKAGNKGSSPYITRTVIRDTIAPKPPGITVVSPTAETSPQFTLKPGDGGTDRFIYSVDNGEPDKFEGSTVTISLPYGGSTVYFQCLDPAGNLSELSNTTVAVYPKEVYPANGLKVSGIFDLAWVYKENLYFEVHIGSTEEYKKAVESKSELSGLNKDRKVPYVDFKELTWKSGETYYWYIKLLDKEFNHIDTIPSTVVIGRESDISKCYSFTYY